MPLGYPKPDPKPTRQQRRDAEYRVLKAVREQAMKRDLGCRFPSDPECPHGGPLELAHLGEYRRSKTGGRPPEERHVRHGVAMLCRRHHQQYDAHEVQLSAGEELGDGNLIWRWRDGRFIGVSRPRVVTGAQE